MPKEKNNSNANLENKDKINNRRNQNNLDNSDKLHKKGESNNSISSLKNSSNSKNNGNDFKKRATTEVASRVADKFAPGVGGKAVKFATNNFSNPTKKNPNIGRKNLNNNNGISQPSVSSLNKEKEKNQNKLKEQIEKNAVRAIANAVLPGVGGKTVDTLSRVKDLKSKKNKLSSDSNTSKEKKDSSSEIVFDFLLKNKKILMILLPSIFLFFMLFMCIITFSSESSNFQDLVGVGSSGIAPDVKGASGGNEKLASVYTNILNVQSEYAGVGKHFSADLLMSSFHILMRYDQSFKISKITDSLIREVADYMFIESCNEVGVCSYHYSEETFKNNLETKFFPKYLSTSKCAKATTEVFQYIKDYQELMGLKGGTTGSCTMTGNTQVVDLGGGDYDRCIQILGPIANEAYGRTGIFASVTLAQAIIESGCGREVPDNDSNNLFGIKCSSTLFSLSTWDGTCTNPVSTPEEVNGHLVTIQAKFRKYKSVNEAVLDHAALLAEGRAYTPRAVAQATTPAEQIDRLVASGYATDSSYAFKLKRAIQQYNLEQWDTKSYTMCSSSSGDYSTWLQTDSRWSSIALGSSRATIGSAGCLSTALAMLVQKYNSFTNVSGEFNPGSFVKALNSNGGYDSNGNLNWQAVTRVVPFFTYQNNISLSSLSKEEKLSIIKQYANSSYATVIEVKGRTGQHWVALDSVVDDKIMMMDPASNSINMWYEYNWANTSRLVYYKVG